MKYVITFINKLSSYLKLSVIWNKECMIKRCPQCSVIVDPSAEIVMGAFEEDEMIQFLQWTLIDQIWSSNV